MARAKVLQPEWRLMQNPDGKTRQIPKASSLMCRTLGTPDSPFSVPNSVWALASLGGGDSVRKGLGKRALFHHFPDKRVKGQRNSMTAAVHLFTPGYLRCAGPVARTD